VNRRSEGYASGSLKWLVIVLFAALPMLTVCALPVAAWGAVSGVTVTLAPDSVFVGDRIHCIIGVRHPANELVALEGIDSLSVQPFELISRKQSSSIVSV